VSRPLVFRRVARSEYTRSIKWYEDQRPGLGTEFEAEVNAVLTAIADHPDRYAVADGDVREAPVHRFPYSVFYRVRGDRVIVLAVFHQSRDPSAWQSRSQPPI
jgi:plasmid stabilization system protein ParE